MGVATFNQSETRVSAKDLSIEERYNSREISEGSMRYTVTEFGEVEEVLTHVKPDIILCDIDGVVLNFKATALGIKPVHFVSSLFGHKKHFLEQRAIDFVTNLTKKETLFITNRTRFTKEANFWRTDELVKNLEHEVPEFKIIDGLDRQSGNMRIFSKKDAWMNLEMNINKAVSEFKKRGRNDTLKISIISDEFFDIADIVQPVYSKLKETYRAFNNLFFKFSPHNATLLALATHNLKESIKQYMNIETLSEPPIGDYRFIKEVEKYISRSHSIKAENIEIHMIRISMLAKLLGSDDNRDNVLNIEG